MKKLITCMVLLIPGISIKTDVKAAILTAIANGSWNDPTVWDSGFTPICGDTIVVPATFIVTVTANVDLNDPGDALCPNVRITIGGRLLFNNGKKMDLAVGACLTVDFGGRIARSSKGGGASESISFGTGNGNYWQSSDGNLDGFAASPCGAVVLPVQLISFTVEEIERGAELKWVVGIVEDLDYYLVEKSEDGRTWEYLAKISIELYGTENKNFSYLDENFGGFATTYYRLNSVDNSGLYATLDTKVLLPNANLEKGEMIVAPNPANVSDAVVLHFDADFAQDVELVISNQLGQVVYQQIVKIAPEQNSYLLESNLLNKGQYFVSLNSNNKQLKSKLTLL